MLKMDQRRVVKNATGREEYDFWIAIYGRLVYIETILIDDPTDPIIHVVSIHDA